MTPLQALELIKGLAAAIQESSPEAQREVVLRVFRRIAIRDDQVVDVDVHPVYAEAFRWYLRPQPDKFRTSIEFKRRCVAGWHSIGRRLAKIAGRSTDRLRLLWSAALAGPSLPPVRFFVRRLSHHFRYRFAMLPQHKHPDQLERRQPLPPKRDDTAVRNNGRLMELDDWGRDFDRRGWPGQREYQMLVELADIQPRIWRRLVLADTTPLPLLHRILQIAFVWQDRHLHEFKVGSIRFGVPDEDFAPPPIDERRVRLYQIAYEPGDRFVYMYDFGDSWHHEALLEDLRAVPEPPTPKCLEGRRASPPEDCGGLDGYERLLSVLEDPKNAEHEDARLWAGSWAPERLDLDGINRRLARLPRGVVSATATRQRP